MKHKFDETMVIAVLVVAALVILVTLASYINVTGKAFTSLPTKDSIANNLNKGISIKGEGVVICDRTCSNNLAFCVIAKDSEGTVPCKSRIKGEYSCLCVKP